jgi:deoxyribose-phosphate aldolase
MKIEYCFYDTTYKDIEIIEHLNKVIKYSQVETVSVLPPYVKLVKNNLQSINPYLKISCPIDYPLGIMESVSRFAAAEKAVKAGAEIIDIVCQSSFLTNRKYDKVREDIQLMLSLSSEYNVKVRYILEYRQFTYELLYKISQILYDNKIDTIYPSTGYFMDDIFDNILASAMINKKVPNINIICTGNVWHKNQIETIKKSNIYGLRLNSLNGLALLSN